jgi:hypothetical protein
VPWVYPRGYWCKKCHNTGVKLKNGLSCQDCYSRFARQNSNVQYVPPPQVMSYGWSPLGPLGYGGYGGYGYGGYGGYGYRPTTTIITPVGPPGRVVQPGDPSIGGILCGNCRGRGQLYDLLGDYPCGTCRGIGRLL